jgi:hypothetical protein
MEEAQTKRQARHIEQDVSDEDDLYEAHIPSSTRRYNQPIDDDTLDDVLQGSVIQRRRSQSAPHPTSTISTASTPRSGSSGTSTHTAQKGKSIAPRVPAPISKPKSKRLPLSLPAIIIGMVVMAVLAMSLTSLASWWKVHQDDMQYGRPRTFQLDAVVGHNDSPANPTHFILINLNRHIQIIELPGGDSTHARIYSGPVLFGNGQDLTPITGEVRDVNGDGKPDLIVHIQDQQLVFINDGTQFRPLQPGEHVNT